MKERFPTTGLYSAYQLSEQQKNISAYTEIDMHLQECQGDIPPEFSRYDKPIQQEEEVFPVQPFPTDKASLNEMLLHLSHFQAIPDNTP